MSGRLRELAAEWGVDEEGLRALEALLAILAEDPTAPTTVRDPVAAVDLHVGDALAGLAVAELAAASRIADIGAGAGIPGLVLAAARPRAAVVEVESVGRKCAFMERAVERMGLANAEVACTRVESWAAGRETCDAVTARAVASLAVLVEYAAPLLRPGGALVCWKGSPEADEILDGDHAAVTLGLTTAERVDVPPFPGAERRTLYVYRRVGSVPYGYPRRPGMARKRPITRST